MLSRAHLAGALWDREGPGQAVMVVEEGMADCGCSVDDPRRRQILVGHRLVRCGRCIAPTVHQTRSTRAVLIGETGAQARAAGLSWRRDTCSCHRPKRRLILSMPVALAQNDCDTPRTSWFFLVIRPLRVLAKYPFGRHVVTPKASGSGRIVSRSR